jgi:hypothetical protein
MIGDGQLKREAVYDNNYCCKTSTDFFRLASVVQRLQAFEDSRMKKVPQSNNSALGATSLLLSRKSTDLWRHTVSAY